MLILILITTYLLANVDAVTFTLGFLYHDYNYDLSIAFKYGVARHNMFTEDDVYFKTNMLEISETDLYNAGKIACNMTSSADGIAAIFGPESAYTTPMVQSVCSNLEIPHFQISWRPSMSYNTQTILNFYPETDLLAQAIATILTHLQWKNYVILYQHTEGLLRLQEVLKSMKQSDTPVILRQLNPEGDYRSLLKYVKQMQMNQLVVDCDLDVILSLLEQAKDIDFLDYFHGFFFTSLDAHTLDFSHLETMANISTIRIVDPNNPVLHNAVRDWEVGELNSGRYFKTNTSKIRTEVALMHDAVNLFMMTLTELHVTQPIATKPLYCNDTETWSDGYRLVVYMKVKEMLNTVTGPIKFNEEGKRVGFELQLVEIMNNAQTLVAKWSSDVPNHIHLIRTASEHAKQVIENLQKTVVIVSSRIGPPYLMRRQAQYPGEVLEGNSRYEGYSLDLIDAIAQQLNFSYQFVLTKDGKYGGYDPKTKAWNGLIKDLLDRNAHLAICDLTITHARRQVVDFSMPFMTLGISILYRKMSEEKRDIFAFMDPLETEVWLYIGTAYISLTIIIYLIARMAPGDWENPHPCDQDPSELENTWTLKNCLWLLLGSTMSQGCDILPKGISSRMAISLWWFLILIINSSYTANLAAFLTMERMGPTIDSAEALAKQTKIKYGTVEGGSTQAFFKESNYSTYKKMWQQMVTAKPTVFETNNADGVKRVLSTKNSLYAFLMESSSIEYEIERNCDLKRVGNRLDSKGYGIAMPMNAPYRGEINKVILQLQEEGQLGVLKTKWWKIMHGGGACDEVEEQKNANELALDNVGGIFVVLGVGVGMAFGFTFVEFLWNVRNVSVEEHVSYWEAFVAELRFAVNVTVTKKRVKLQNSESDDSSSESKSIADHFKKVGSFLQLEVLDKISINRNM